MSWRRESFRRGGKSVVMVEKTRKVGVVEEVKDYRREESRRGGKSVVEEERVIKEIKVS